MSASTKKKLRSAERAEKLTQKQLEEQKEAKKAAKKANGRISQWLKGVLDKGTQFADEKHKEAFGALDDAVGLVADVDADFVLGDLHNLTGDGLAGADAGQARHDGIHGKLGVLHVGHLGYNLLK